MPVELSIEGADKLSAVARALKQYGRADLKKELYSGLNRATKPMRAAARIEALVRLPRRGGLNVRVAKTRLSTRRRPGRNPAVWIIAAPNAVKDAGAINRGRVKHPTFGHRPSVIQMVKPGWFTGPMEAGAPAAREELVRVLDGVAEKIVLVQSASRKR